MLKIFKLHNIVSKRQCALKIMVTVRIRSDLSACTANIILKDYCKIFNNYSPKWR